MKRISRKAIRVVPEADKDKLKELRKRRAMFAKPEEPVISKSKTLDEIAWEKFSALPPVEQQQVKLHATRRLLTQGFQEIGSSDMANCIAQIYREMGGFNRVRDIKKRGVIGEADARQHVQVKAFYGDKSYQHEIIWVRIKKGNKLKGSGVVDCEPRKVELKLGASIAYDTNKGEDMPVVTKLRKANLVELLLGDVASSLKDSMTFNPRITA